MKAGTWLFNLHHHLLHLETSYISASAHISFLSSYLPLQFHCVALITSHPRLHSFERTHADYSFLAAISQNFGEGVTGRAVSERMLRMKKEPDWNLANTMAENLAPQKSTPGKRATNKSTPTSSAKKGFKMNMNDGGSADDDDESFDPSPSKKKGALNKVKSGRIAKPHGRASQASYAEETDEDEEQYPVKGEDGADNMNGYHHGNGYDDDGHEDQYFDIDETRA